MGAEPAGAQFVEGSRPDPGRIHGRREIAHRDLELVAYAAHLELEDWKDLVETFLLTEGRGA